MVLVSGSWLESPVSKVNMSCELSFVFFFFFKLIYFNFIFQHFNLFEIGLHTYFSFLSIGLSRSCAHDRWIYGLTQVN